MAENSAIQWTDHTRERMRLYACGMKSCCRCKELRPCDYFGRDKSRWDHLDAKCLMCRAAMNRKGRVSNEDKTRQRGRRFVAARDNDRLQARGRVNHLMRVGELPKPVNTPCCKCGHLGDDRRHEFHHHNGYGVEHHDDVVVLCSKCHAAERTVDSRNRNDLGQFAKEVVCG